MLNFISRETDRDRADMSLATANDSRCAVTAFIYQRLSAGKSLSISTPHFIIHNPHVKDTVVMLGKRGSAM